jgi:hypothetical protein
LYTNIKILIAKTFLDKLYIENESRVTKLFKEKVSTIVSS